jgi:tRNA(adenine34) deaminase
MSQKYMKEALKEAKKAYLLGEVPIGAVIVHNDKIISRGHNRKETTKMATAHAEIMAIEKACRRMGDWRLNECDLYVTVEPCLMCSGAILQSRIKRLFYGARNEKFGCVESIEDILNNNKHNHHIEIERNVCEAEAVALLQQFFEDNRKRKG